MVLSLFLPAWYNRAMACPAPLTVVWHKRTRGFTRWLAAHPGAEPRFRSSGREGDIWQLGAGASSTYILKRWTHHHEVLAAERFRFLRAAADAGLPVPPAAGWGHDAEWYDVLATAYAGSLAPRTPEMLSRAGGVLAAIHRVPIRPFRRLLPEDRARNALPLVARLFSGLAGEPDLPAAAAAVAAGIRPGAPRLVHGDFHPGNILLDGDQLVVADWTEARLGDAGYDLAWASVLLLIYTGEWARACFLAAYESDAGLPAQFPLLEALAALRWLLLARTAPVPIEAEKIFAAHDLIDRSTPAAIRRLIARTPVPPPAPWRV